jgi:mannose-6-phosphate isomerase-like protein (cupin superfamily)
MATPVYDYRNDIANVVVRPEIRSRFMRMEPAPAGLMHSHDLGGEIFLVLEGQCEFLIEDERVTCGPGQLIYIEPRIKHTLHAVGNEACVVYLSVTPHVEPTHTHYDEGYNLLAPRYGGWRGKEFVDTSADRSTVELAESYEAAAQKLAATALHNAEVLTQRMKDLRQGDTASNQPAFKQTMDEMWAGLRDVLQQVSETERVWNELAPRARSPE